MFRIDVGPPVKQRIEAVCVFPSLQVEHVEQTLGEHSPLLTPICSSPTIPMPMPMHHELFCSHSRISHLLIAHWVAGDTTALSVPTRKYLWSSGWTALPTLVGTPLPLLHPSPLPTPPRLPHVARASAAVLKKRRACVPGAASFAGHDSTHESSAFSTSQLFHLVSPHSPTSLQVDDLGEDSDGTNHGGLE